MSEMPLYVITVGTHPKTYSDMASHGPLVATSARSCAARKLARLMNECGIPDGPIEARDADGKVRYRVKSLHRFAGRSLTENPALHTIKYEPRSPGAWGRS